jgi:hypothetical protein
MPQQERLDMSIEWLNGAALLLAVALMGCAADAPAGDPAQESVSHSASNFGIVRPAATPDNPKWQVIAKVLKPGEYKDEVYTVVYQRADLEVGHLDFGLLPPSAGLESRLHFFLCPCGKVYVAGQLCVADYEMNDVIDELRWGNLKVASAAPMFIGDRPKVMLVRIQGEGGVEKITETLRKALQWMGEGRVAEPAK